MAQYLLAVHNADAFHLPPEEMLQSFADTGAFNARLEDAGAFVFAGGLDAALEWAKLARSLPATPGSGPLTSNGRWPRRAEPTGRTPPGR